MAGYGWVFPLGDGLLNVGAGLLNTFKRFKEVSAKRLMDVFLRQLPAGAWDQRGERGGAVAVRPDPHGDQPDAARGARAAAGGRCRGVTNPFNGEGIAYAMETGELAAELLAEALAVDRPAVAHDVPARSSRSDTGATSASGRPSCA